MAGEGDILDDIAGMGVEASDEGEGGTEEDALLASIEDDGEEAAPEPEGDDEGEGEGDDKAKAKAKPEAEAAPPKPRTPKLTAEEVLERYGDVGVKVKVDGEEKTVPLKELKDGYSLRSAALKRMDEAARVKQEFGKRVQQIEQAVKDPQTLRMLMRRNGIDEQKFAFEIAKEHIALQRKSPQEQAEYWRKQQEEQWETERQRKEREQMQAQRTQLAKAEAQKLRAQIPSVLEKHGLPANDDVVRRLASVMRRAHAAGYPIDIETGVQATKEELLGMQRSLASSMTGAQLAEWLGPEAMKRVRRYEVDRLKGRGSAPAQSAPRKGPPKTNGATRMKSVEEILDSIR